MFRSTVWAIALFLAASPALAQTSTNSIAPSFDFDAVSAAYAGGVSAARPGIAVTNPAAVRNLRVQPVPAADLPGPAVPLTPLDFGGYEPYVPRLARKVLPDTPNNTDPFQITLSGTPTRTTIGAKVQTKPSDTVTVRARATSSIPGLPVLGDKAYKWRPTPDLKVDVRYKF